MKKSRLIAATDLGNTCESLNEISDSQNCPDIPVGLKMSCETNGRGVGATLISLKHLEDMIAQMPKEEVKRPRVLIVGKFDEPMLSKNMFLFIEKLKELNVEVHFHSTMQPTIGRIGEEKYNHSYSHVITGNSLLKIREDFKQLHEIDFKINSQFHTTLPKPKLGINNKTVKVKSSKKGKGGQSGSNFHR